MTKFRLFGRRSAASLHLELRQTGGIAGLDQQIVLDGKALRVLDRGQVRTERQLTASQVGEVTELINELDRHAPRPQYGGGRQVPDALSFRLTYTTPSGTTIIAVESGADPPPEPFLKLVRHLGEYGR